MCLVLVQLHLALPDDVVDSRVLQDSVSFLQLAHAADAKQVLELEDGHGGDEQLPHDLRGVVVRVEHLADDGVVRNVATIELRVDALHLFEVLGECEQGDDVECEALAVVVDVDRQLPALPGRCGVPRIEQQPDPLLHRLAEALQREGVHEGFLAHHPVLAVVLSVAPRDSLVFDDVAEGVREHPEAVVFRVGVADVLHDVRVHCRDAQRSDHVFYADGFVPRQRHPLQHRLGHSHVAGARLDDGLEEDVRRQHRRTPLGNGFFAQPRHNARHRLLGCRVGAVTSTLAVAARAAGCCAPIAALLVFRR
mmetsp:Transcript_390/g.609  ORF Transcript_390/g.609 Transcript_390/m.609 type:complete len:308 (-) Transcript_390:111-1034(-)